MDTQGEIFGPSNPNPIISMVFSVREYQMDNIKIKDYPIDYQNDKVTCIGFSKDFPVDFKRILLVRPEFFYTENGTFTRSFIKNFLLHPYDVKKLTRDGNMIGIIWSNVLKDIEPLYHARLGNIKIWEYQIQAKKSFTRTLQLLRWATSLSSYLQKNVSWKEVQDMFLEYANNVSYPLSTLQSNFQEVAKRHTRPTNLQ